MQGNKRIGRSLVRRGNKVNFYCDKMQIPDGRIEYYDFISHKGAAAVVPILENGKILMVKQYRNSIDRFTLEIPAGALDYEDEPFIECARRELREETGYSCDNIEFLVSNYSTVAICNERIDIFIARNLSLGQQDLDDDEFIDVYEYDLEELKSMIFEGKIQDAKTICGILAYESKFLR
ncbi:ADP-ribose pyrophosphatase [Acetitomaculum ruminis DSM 5522]|uniref:ADP-ribose pyrophosphatase n=1 Tax=Acetitomaculum ruminis DSM 5522 TaxID=1120918 RepID=A0A1I0ZG74_9FIRM|nr:NUDIX hydrolase [Acetitomaculum ruminis]SFB24531.1 ADP-ribose pyrophosphatase [Acetitomaculum ruminis DSM 5522]